MMLNSKSQYLYPITIGFFIIVICNVLGHYIPPFSLMTTYIYMNIIIGKINSPLFKVSFRFTIIYSFFLLLINDYLIRKFAGGSHDGPGMAWCTVMFGLTILISFVIMLIEIFKVNKVETISKKEVTINFSVLIIGLLFTIIYYLNIQYKI
jgi:hypothetical protein